MKSGLHSFPLCAVCVSCGLTQQIELFSSGSFTRIGWYGSLIYLHQCIIILNENHCVFGYLQMGFLHLQRKQVFFLLLALFSKVVPNYKSSKQYLISFFRQWIKSNISRHFRWISPRKTVTQHSVKYFYRPKIFSVFFPDYEKHFIKHRNERRSEIFLRCHKCTADLQDFTESRTRDLKIHF